MSQLTCGFDVAWVGRCRVVVCSEGERCQQHAGLKCCSCGAPATRECDETMQFVCGCPLCDDCEHKVAPNGTNGGTLQHCRKDAQEYQPWYMRENWQEELAQEAEAAIGGRKDEASEAGMTPL